MTKRDHQPDSSRLWSVTLAAVAVLLAFFASSSWLASAPSHEAATLAEVDSIRGDEPAALVELADGLDGEPDDRVQAAHATGDPAARLLVRVRDGDSPGVHSLVPHGTSGARSPPAA